MRHLMIILLLVLIPTNAIADCETNLAKCDKAVHLCADTVKAKNEAIKLCNLALMQSIHRSVDLEVTVEKQDRKLGKWYRSPFITIPLGLAAGVLLIEFAR